MNTATISRRAGAAPLHADDTPERARPDLDLTFAAAGGRIRLVGRHCRWPYVVGKLFVDPDAGQNPVGSTAQGPRTGTLVVQQAGGGTHPGDVRHQRVSVGADVRPRILGQGAVLVHGVPGRACARETTRLAVGSGGGLLHRPGLRVLLPAARLQQRSTIILAPGASAVTVDATVLHPACLPPDAPEPLFDSLLEVVTAEGAEPAVIERTHLNRLTTNLRGWPAFAVVHLLRSAPAPATASATPAWTPTPATYPSHLSYPSFPTDAGVPAQAAVAATSTLPGGVGSAVRICARDGAALRRAIDAAVAWTEQVLAS